MYSGTAAYWNVHRRGPAARPLSLAPHPAAQLGSGFGSSPSTHAAAVRPRCLPARVDRRRRARAAHARPRAPRDRAARARERLVDGRDADLRAGPCGTPTWSSARCRSPPARATPDHDKVFHRRPHGSCWRSDPAFAGGFYRDWGRAPRAAPARARLRAHGRHAGHVPRPGVAGARLHLRPGLPPGLSCRLLPPHGPQTCSARRASGARRTSAGATTASTATALRRITARTIVVAFRGDAFFPPEDVEADAVTSPAPSSASSAAGGATSRCSTCASRHAPGSTRCTPRSSRAERHPPGCARAVGGCRA